MYKLKGDNVRNVYAVGEVVTINGEFTGMIIEISIKRKSVLYRVQKTDETGYTTIWAEDWEITSKPKKITVIRECLITDNEQIKEVL